MEKHREDAEEDVKTWLDAIAVSEARIKECRESIHQMKGVAICPSCGASVDADAAFCSACGQKMPEKPKPEPVKEEDVEVIPPEQPSDRSLKQTWKTKGAVVPPIFAGAIAPFLILLRRVAQSLLFIQMGYKTGCHHDR